MVNGIDILVDCVFKKTFGVPENKEILISFLNAILELRGKQRIRKAVLLNPYNLQEFRQDKLSVVDIKVTDENGVTYQIEAQIGYQTGLAQRMVYNMCQVVREQLTEGHGYKELPKVICLWILKEPLVAKDHGVHLQYQLYDSLAQSLLCNCITIHVLQLKKLKKDIKIRSEKDWWLYLLKHSAEVDLDNPAAWIDTPIGRRVMRAMRPFNQKEMEHDLYLRRQEWLMIQTTERNALKRAQKRVLELETEIGAVIQTKNSQLERKNSELESKDAVIQSKDSELESKDTEIKRLKDLLAANNLDLPDNL